MLVSAFFCTFALYKFYKDMKKSLAFISILGLAATQAHAESYYAGNHVNGAARTLEFHVDSMPTSLSSLPEQNTLSSYASSQPKLNKWAVKGSAASDWGTIDDWDATDGIKPYKFMDDMTFVGVPIFVAGIIAKSEKASFRQNYDNTHSRTRLLTNFHNEIDNYTQYVPFALAAGLNFAGVEGRSDHWRFLASSAMSYAIMAAIVNPIKYSAKEMRPDGSTRNSWPSGHTATAFVSATILHKEYGLTRSPWYSVAGYAVATATGVMRVLNNRHWVSDVLSGAGIGIVSTELAYGISDLLFKGKHLKRNDMPGSSDIIEHPSFFSISMGVGLGSKNLSFSDEDLNMKDQVGNEVGTVDLKFGTATVVGAEGAYFFNKYVGIGGRLRVKSSPIKGWSDVTSQQREMWDTWLYFQDEDFQNKFATTRDITIESDHITEFTADFGAYFNFPLSRRLALGSKLLVGRSIIQDLDVNAHYSGLTASWDEVEEKAFIPTDAKPYDKEWDYVTVSGNNGIKFGTGLSLTYAYKHNFSWKVFVDYDYTRKHYTLEYDPLGFCYNDPSDGTGINRGFPKAYENMVKDYGVSKFSSTIKKHMNSFVIGAAFAVSF